MRTSLESKGLPVPQVCASSLHAHGLVMSATVYMLLSADVITAKYSAC
jgi:hypothetical protein